MSPEGWKSYKLGELVKVKGGKRLPKGKSLQEMQNAHPYIRVSDMGNRIIDKSKLLYVPDKIFTSISRYTVNDGDIIISIVGTIGLISQVTAELDNASLTENCVKFTNLNGVLREYLYYFLISENCQNEIRSKTVGTTQPKLPLYNINSLQIKVPPLPTQHRIVDILSALDDKIELNRQTNATLEAIAQAIFKEWFVDFNFPGATGEMVESELGLIPSGWRAGKLGEICMVVMGQSPPGDSYNEIGEGTPFFQGRSDFGFRFPTKRIFTTNPKRFAEKFNTLVSVRAPVGDMNIAIENCCIGRGLAAVIEKNGNSTYTYYFLKHLTENFRKFEDNGTVFGSINKNDFQDMKCIIPKREVIALFETICNPIDETIYNNHQESVNLSSIRDTLLPKLINGEIEL